MKTRLILFCAITVMGLLTSTPAVQAQDSAKDRIAALKANLASSKATLRQYEWIQTTTVSMNGDVKSTKQERCYYGDDGSLQKVEIGGQAAPQQQGRLFRRIKERKKEEMSDYMKSAVALVKSYVPPSSTLIQNAKDDGNVSMTPSGGGKISVVFKSYLKQGDTYVLNVNLQDSRPLGVKVSTYLDGPSDVVKMSATMGQLNNGATFTKDITLNAESKGLTVTVHNGGYERKN